MLYCQPAPDYLPDPEACLLTGILPQTCLAQGVPEHAFADVIEDRAGAARHGGRGLQLDPLRRRGHAPPVLAQPDRPLCARMAERVRPLGPARRGARAPGRCGPKASSGRTHEDGTALVQAGAPDQGQRPGARGGARCAVGRARHHRDGPADQAAPAQAVGLLPAPAQERRSGARDGCRPALPARLGHVRRGARLHRPGVAAGAAPDQQERGDRVGPGRRPVASCSRWTSMPSASACSARPTTCPRARRACRSRPSTSTSRPSWWATTSPWRGDGRASGASTSTQALRHAELAAQKGQLLAGMWPAVFERPAPESTPDVDEDLYGGFIGNEDRRTLQRLRSLSPAQLADKRPAFADKRLDELFFRYRARNFPATLERCRAGAVARALRSPPARWRGRRADAGCLLGAHRRAGSESRRRTRPGHSWRPGRLRDRDRAGVRGSRGVALGRTRLKGYGLTPF